MTGLQVSCRALRCQNTDDAGLTVSVRIETRRQADGVADKLRLVAAQGTNDGERATAGGHEHHHPRRTDGTRTAHRNMVIAVRGGKAYLYGEEAAELAAVLAVHIPVFRAGQVTHDGVGQFAAEVFAAVPPVLKLITGHRFQYIGGQNSAHGYLLIAAPQGGAPLSGGVCRVGGVVVRAVGI